MGTKKRTCNVKRQKRGDNSATHTFESQHRSIALHTTSDPFISHFSSFIADDVTEGERIDKDGLSKTRSISFTISPNRNWK